MSFLSKFGKGLFGSGGEQSRYVSQGANSGLANSLARESAVGDRGINSAMGKYGSGGMSYQDLMKSASGYSADTSGVDAQIANLVNQSNQVGNNGDLDEQDRSNQIAQIGDQISTLEAQKSSMSRGGGSALMDAIATGSGTGNKFASDQVLNDNLYSGLFGKEGLQGKSQGLYDKYSSQVDEDREALKGRGEGYGLQASDLEAYNQASGNIARQFGAQGNNLASMMADRGLSSGASGPAAQAFSGLAGNQMEQLAQSQRAIAQQRIQTAMGLAQSRMQASLMGQNNAGQLSLGIGQLGKQAQGQYYNQNLAGVMNRQGHSDRAAQLAIGNQAQQQDISNEFFSQQQATQSPGIFENIGQGINYGLSSSLSEPFASPGRAMKSISSNAGPILSKGMSGGAA